VAILRANKQLDKIVPPHLDAHAVLSACDDFMNERTALQEAVESRGHILLPSVVCTPETAGSGVEYAFGKLKFEHRKANTDVTVLRGGQEFISRVKALCVREDIFHINITRCWKFTRRARDYMRVYEGSMGRQGETALTYREIESLRNACKTHRNMMEHDRVFIHNT